MFGLTFGQLFGICFLGYILISGFIWFLDAVFRWAFSWLLSLPEKFRSSQHTDEFASSSE